MFPFMDSSVRWKYGVAPGRKMLLMRVSPFFHRHLSRVSFLVHQPGEEIRINKKTVFFTVFLTGAGLLSTQNVESALYFSSREANPSRSA
jgi:hypothetical protein